MVPRMSLLHCWGKVDPPARPTRQSAAARGATSDDQKKKHSHRVPAGKAATTGAIASAATPSGHLKVADCAYGTDGTTGSDPDRPLDPDLDVAALERRIKDDPRNANEVLVLLDHAEAAELEPGVRYKAIHALHRSFLQVGAHRPAPKSDTAPSPAGAQPVVEYAQWLHLQYLEFVKVLLVQIAAAEPGLGTAALKIAMSLVVETGRLSSTKRGGAGYKFPNALLSRVVAAVVSVDGVDGVVVVDAYVQQYIGYDDVRHYTLRTLGRLCDESAVAIRASAAAQRRLIINTHSLVSRIEMPTADAELCGAAAEDEDSDAAEYEYSFLVQPVTGEHPLLSLGTHRRSFSKCWLGLLKLRLPSETLKAVLVALPNEVPLNPAPANRRHVAFVKE